MRRQVTAKLVGKWLLNPPDKKWAKEWHTAKELRLTCLKDCGLDEDYMHPVYFQQLLLLLDIIDWWEHNGKRSSLSRYRFTGEDHV